MLRCGISIRPMTAVFGHSAMSAQCPACPKAATERAAVDGSNVPYRSLPPFAYRNIMEFAGIARINPL
jgi:hypothetical protein